MLKTTRPRVYQKTRRKFSTKHKKVLTKNTKASRLKVYQNIRRKLITKYLSKILKH